MIKHLSILAVFASCLLASGAVYAQAGKAPCGSFQKLPNGKWSVVKTIKIENKTASAVLNPGTILDSTTRVAGADLFAVLERSCH
jgi:hypothetical protein